MQKIEIATTQNVIIQYDEARTSERVYAFVIDLMLSFAIFLVFVLCFNLIPSLTSIGAVMGIAAGFLYPLVAEWTGAGQSYGKKWMKIRVVKMDGKDARGLDF
ncbi:MAG: RDD family protein [Saprospiraceae bacterium]